MRRLYSSLGSFDVRFRYLIVAVWVVVTVGCVHSLPGLGSVAKDTQSGFLPANSASMHAAQLLNPFESSTLATATLVASRSGSTLTARDQTAVTTLVDKVKALPNVVTVHPLGTSSDGEALQVLIQANVPQYGSGAGTTLVDDIRADFTRVGAPGGLQFNLTGQLAIATDSGAASAHSQNATQLLSVLFIIILLLFAFRALLAPLVTLLPAGLVLALAGPVIAAASHIGVQVSVITELILVVLVLGAGTDYGLFLVFRMREELRRGLDPRDAVRRAVATVGESITFSALIVMAALMSLIIAQFDFYQALGPALAIGIALMLIAGLTLLPALLAIFGRAVFWPSRARLEENPRPNVYGRIAARVVRNPMPVAITGAILFGAIAFGQLGTTTAGFADQSTPTGTDSAAGDTLISQHYGSATLNATELLFKFATPIWSHADDLQTLQTTLQSRGGFATVEGPLAFSGQALTPAQLVAIHHGSNTLAAEALARFVSADGRTVQYSALRPAAGQPRSTRSRRCERSPGARARRSAPRRRVSSGSSRSPTT